jgi:hypothetical protein
VYVQGAAALPTENTLTLLPIALDYWETFSFILFRGAVLIGGLIGL